MPSMISVSTYRFLMQLCLLTTVVLGNSLAWATETDQEAPVGSVGGAVHADQFTGMATTSFPIEVPPGRGGVQPDLALIYGSSNGNGWMGQGWKLEKGVIERQTKFGVNYSGDDYVFRLSGINVELVNIGNDEYRAKVEGGFNRIKKMTSSSDNKPYFEVTDNTGKKFTFGTEAATRVANPNNANNIFRWCLERVEDVHGNYMTLSYTPDQGQAYLTQIDYTGNVNGGLPPTNQVKFYLEDRPDDAKMYVPNFEMNTAKRLKTIEVKANGSVIRAYGLNYTTSAMTNHSLLSSVQQYGKNTSVDVSGSIPSNSSALNPLIFTYSEDSLAFDSSILGPSLGVANPDAWATLDLNRVKLGDFNGDGKTDALRLSGWNTGTTDVYLSQGDGTFAASILGPSLLVANPDTPWSPLDLKRVRLGDFNGDGKTDILRLSGWNTGTTDVYLSQGDGTFSTSILGPSLGVTNPDAWAALDLARVQVGDFNGDGKTDILRLSGWNTGTTDVYLSQGDGTFAASILGPSLLVANPDTPWSTLDLNRVRLGDFNGDGKTDILRLSGWNTGTTDVYLSQGDGTFAASVLGPSLGVTNPDTWAALDLARVQVGDFNGDGKTDILRLSGWNTGTTDVYLSQGDGTFAPATLGPSLLVANPDTPWSTLDLNRVRLGDFNDDGKTDILRLSGWNTGTTDVYLSQGDGTFAASILGPSLGVTNPDTWAALDLARVQLGDFSGDGKTDVLRLSGWNTGTTDVYLSANEATNLLTGLSNGLGANTSIEYLPSTQYSNIQLPYPVQTVSQITTNDGHGHVATTTYDYAYGFHHIGERDFRGFQDVTVTNQAGATGEQIRTRTWFHQGNDTALDVNNPNVDDGYLKGAAYRTKVMDETGATLSETTTTYHAPNSTTQAPFFTPPSSVVNIVCDANSSCKSTRTDFTNDIYGNVTREEQHGDMSDGGADDRTITRIFSPNTSAWIIGSPSSQSIYQGLGTGNQVAQTNFYYDGTTNCSTPSTNQQPTKGNLTRVVTWLNGSTDPETRMAYDAYGNVTCARDARGHTTTMTYDSSQTYATSETNHLNQQTATSYYGINGVAMDTGLYGQVKTVTDPNNATTTTKYDVFGRRTQVIQPNGFSTTTYYNGFGTVGQQHVQTVTSEGLSTWTNFDGLGRTFKTRSTATDNKIVVTEVYYDHRGGVTQQSLPYFESGGTLQWTTFGHDPLGRTTKTINPDGSRGLACYDDWVTVTIDANNHRHRTVRDAYGRVATVQEYADTYTTCDTNVGSPYSTTTYAYDVLGNLKTLTDAKGNVSTMTYDTLSRKTAMHDPDIGDWTYTYDAEGNLTQQTDANNQTISFQYDALNRPILKDYVGAGNVVYTYDGSAANRIGRLQKVQDSSGTTTFHYDNMGQVIRTDKVVDGSTYTRQTSYDGLGRVHNLTYPDGSIVTHGYNGPQLKDVKEGSTIYAAYGGFNAQGQPSTLTLGNGVTTTYTYDANNYRLKTLKTVKGSTTLQDLGYTFDAGGNVTNLTDPKHGTQILAYDPLDRLTSASGSAYPTTITYTYDQIGNMLSNSQVGTYNYPPSGSNSVRPHAVTTAGGNSYSYDGNGNMTNGPGRTMSFDYENRPVTITKNGTTTTMVYDGDGGRVKKTVNDGVMTTLTTYIGKLYVCEGTTAPLSCAKMIFASGKRIAMKQANGTVDYFHPDHLGSTSVLTNSNGVSEQDLAYDPYGETRVNTGGGSATVEEWKLEVGSFAGGNDLYQSSGLGLQTSDTVSSLPTDGSQVYVTLSYKIAGQWDHDDYVYTASNSGGSPLVITSPAPGSTLTSNSVTFTGGHTSSDFAHSLWVGTTFGSNNLSVGGVTNHSKTVSNLPNSGMIYVRYYTQVGPNSSDPNDWSSEDHTYTMNVGGGTPLSLSPTAVTVSGGGQQTFTGVGGVPPYTFTVLADTSGGATVQATSGQYTAGPNAGTSTVQVTDGVNGTANATVTVQASGLPVITSPAPGSTLTTNTVIFIGGHTSSNDYSHSLWVGTTFGGNDLSYGGVTNHSKTISNLPNTGTIYVRYHTQVGPNASDSNDWASTDQTYTMNVGGGTPLTLSPTTGTVSAGGQQTFTGAGGVPPYTFTVIADTTGGATVQATTGQYTAGPNAGTSTVQVMDSVNGTANATVTVQASGLPVITSPAPGSTLTTNTVTFIGGHTSPNDYSHSLWVGTTFGGNDLSYGGVTNHSKTISNLPNTGTIYVRYHTQVGPNASDSNDWASTDQTYTMNVGGSASLTLENPTIYLAAMSSPVQIGPSHVHQLDWEPTDSTPTTRIGGGLFSLRFGIPQLATPPSNPLMHLVSHGSASSTTISPGAGSVLSGTTVTFSWSYNGGSSSGTDVAYKYTGKERDDSTGLYFYEARYYDAMLGRFISADTIVPDLNNPQALNRYTYTLNNPLRFTDPTGHRPQQENARDYYRKLFIKFISRPRFGGSSIQRPDSASSSSANSSSANSTSTNSTSPSESSPEQTLLENPHSISSSQDGAIGATGSLQTQPDQGGDNLPFVKQPGKNSPTLTEKNLTLEVDPSQEFVGDQLEGNVRLARLGGGSRQKNRFDRVGNPMSLFDQQSRNMSDLAINERDLFSIPLGKDLIRNDPNFPNILKGEERGYISTDIKTGKFKGITIDRFPPAVDDSKTQLSPFRGPIISSP